MDCHELNFKGTTYSARNVWMNATDRDLTKEILKFLSDRRITYDQASRALKNADIFLNTIVMKETI